MTARRIVKVLGVLALLGLLAFIVARRFENSVVRGKPEAPPQEELQELPVPADSAAAAVDTIKVGP